MAIEPDDLGDAEVDAEAADVQEQQRPVRDSALDPEHVVQGATPDVTRIDADSADVQEQSIDVADEEE